MSERRGVICSELALMLLKGMCCLPETIWTNLFDKLLPSLPCLLPRHTLGRNLFPINPLCMPGILEASIEAKRNPKEKKKKQSNVRENVCSM